MNEPRVGDGVNDCRELEPVLSAYVDGEASDSDRARVRAHLETCSACRERVAGEQAARDAVRARRSALRACAPDALKARCAAHAAVRPSIPPSRLSAPARPARLPAPPASFVRRWAPLSLAATLVLAVVTVFGFGLNNKVQALAFQTTIDHVTCSRLKTADHVDAGAAAQRWLARFGWPITVPEPSQESGLELQAVRRCAVTDGRVAHLMYTWMGEPLSVYVLPKRTLGDATEFVRRFRHNTVMWSQNDRTYIIVTPRPRDPALDSVVAYVRARAY
jgi:anti-sigma factor (TIGR02949 family)